MPFHMLSPIGHPLADCLFIYEYFMPSHSRSFFSLVKYHPFYVCLAWIEVHDHVHKKHHSFFLTMYILSRLPLSYSLFEFCVSAISSSCFLLCQNILYYVFDMDSSASSCSQATLSLFLPHTSSHNSIALYVPHCMKFVSLFYMVGVFSLDHCPPFYMMT